MSLAGVNVLLEGPTGTGKTYAIGSWVDWALANNTEVFVLFTENGLETLLGYWADKGKPVPPNLHWHNALVKPVGLEAMKTAADNVGRLSYDSITKLTDHNRSQNNAFHGILTACSDFPDDRTGKKFGPVDSWGVDRIFVVDGLSELSNAAMKMVIGSRPTAGPADYGVSQNNLMNFLRLATNGIRCHFGMTAHVTREKDEITGGIKLMTKAIGAAISGDIPPLFSDVIYCTREGGEWYWDTATTLVDVKTRNLPVASKIQPNFTQIMEKWKARSTAAAA